MDVLSRQLKARADTYKNQAEIYVARSNLSPHVWGPAMWDYMFAVALAVRGLRNGDTRVVQRHMRDIATLIPCRPCRCHYRAHLRRTPPPDNGDDMFAWVWHLKSDVNRRLGKPNLGLDAAFAKHKSMPVRGVVRAYVRMLLRRALPRAGDATNDVVRSCVGPVLFARRLRSHARFVDWMIRVDENRR